MAERYIFQEEICPKTERRHLQGYFELKKKQRMASILKALSPFKPHLEVAKGGRIDNIKYCTKEESRAPGGLRRAKGLAVPAPLKVHIWLH